MINLEGVINSKISIDGEISKDFICLNARFYQKVEISNCTFSKFKIISSYFYQGLNIRNCIIENFACIETGGYNQKPIHIIDTKFKTFFDIIDCSFESLVALKNVEFLKGTNLFGNIGTPIENDFEVQPTLINVTGKLDIKTYKY